MSKDVVVATRSVCARMHNTLYQRDVVLLLGAMLAAYI